MTAVAKMNMETLELLNDTTMDRDRAEFSLGDTYDIQASIVLVIATFLGTLCIEILSLRNLPAFLKAGQFLAILALLASGIFSILVLRLRAYDLEGHPKTIRAWLEKRIGQLEQHYAGRPNAPKDLEQVALSEALLARFDKACERITVHRAINDDKQKWLDRSFMTARIAFLLEALSLLCLWFLV